MFRMATAGRTVWFVAVFISAAVLSTIVGLGELFVADGSVSGTFQVSGMVLPPIEPWGWEMGA